MMIFLVNLIFFMNSSFAQEENMFCIELESISIGCFPSEDHPCKRIIAKNSEEEDVGTSNFKCTFYKNVMLHLENDDFGPIAFKCQSWKEDSPCSNPEYTGHCNPDDCDIPHDPTCRQKCTKCVEEKIKEFVEYQPIGCTVFCRDRCRDEPRWDGEIYPYCGGDDPPDACKEEKPDCAAVEPPEEGFIPTRESDVKLCNSIKPCPKYVQRTSRGWEEVTEDNPNAVEVEIGGKLECPPADDLEPPHEGTKGKVCPWMKKFGESRKNCEEIPECCKWPKIENYDQQCPNGCVVPSGEE